jgi:hypothetical protein
MIAAKSGSRRPTAVHANIEKPARAGFLGGCGGSAFRQKPSATRKETKTMPDGAMSDFARQTETSATASAPRPRKLRRILFDWNASPIELGLVTADQFSALKRHLAAMKAGEARGEADPGALHAATTLNGWPLNPPVYRGSMRYWWLMALNEKEWAARREGYSWFDVPRRKLTAREKVADNVYSAMSRLHSVKSNHYNYSRFYRVLAEDCQSHDAVAHWDAIDREERKRALMQWRAQSQKPMKAALATIARYEAMFPKEGER